MRDWASPVSGWLPVCGLWLGRSRTGRSPAAVAAPEASLRCLALSPMLASREAGAARAWRVSGCLVRPMSGVPVAGSAAGCSHPFACPGRGWVAWGGSASERGGQAGSIKGAPALLGRRGRHRGDLAPGRWPAGLFMRPALAGRGPGQAADLPVAQAVEDQGEQPAGGGDLRDVLGFLTAAGDDRVFDRAGDRVRGGSAGRPRSVPSAAAASPAW